MKGGLCRLRGTSERRPTPSNRGAERGRSQSGTGRTTAPLQPLAAWSRPHPSVKSTPPWSSRLCLLRGQAALPSHLAAQSSPIKPFKAPRPSSSLPPKSLPKFQAAELSAPPRSDILLSNSLVNNQHCTSSPLCQFRSAAEQNPKSESSSSRTAPAHNDGLYPNSILYWSPALRAVHRHPAHHAGAHQLGRVG